MGPALNATLASYYTGCLVSAVKTFHDAGVVLRDVKPENLGLLSDGRIKMCDFGLAEFEDNLAHVQNKFTESYASPEALRNHGVTKKSDIWSIGVSLLVMLTSVLPFEEGEVLYQINSKQQHRIRTKLSTWVKLGLAPFPKADKHLVDQAQHLISWCLGIKPEKRPTVDEVMEHVFLKRFVAEKWIDVSPLRLTDHQGKPILTESDLKNCAEARVS